MKGFLTFIVLRMIGGKEMSGQDIRQEMQKRKGTNPSPGTIYPVLKFLRKSGFIEELDGDGRTKKYRLTKKGKKELDAATARFCRIFYDMRDDFDRRCN
ncbi:PadR family transcriptional regulator [Candidatus Woesearchaeota archaeon]|nr:PadR family transcriptional regulator [Candidatus Woesearchaeota archaeon]MBI2131074.1 PadR family transcriptional regulator [Candidatus Woesearchaeota archaeon]MBI2660652.1 PadR family transcriptional regulator [Candidatus Woesearchaeota archaeon]